MVYKKLKKKKKNSFRQVRKKTKKENKKGYRILQHGASADPKEQSRKMHTTC